MKKKKPSALKIETPQPADKVLLHACCAPCSSAIVGCMLGNGIQPTLFYCNPNIYPAEEYEKRKQEAERFAREMGIDFVEDPYDHDAWLAGVKGLEGEPERGNRCLRCFELRLSAAARYAAEHGYTLLTTTLASSRWKRLDQIDAAGLKATAPYADVTFWEQNWRKGGLQERRNQLLKEHGFYNQLYCGCEFSIRQTEEKEEATR